jgi:hypothetical protein
MKKQTSWLICIVWLCLGSPHRATTTIVSAMAQDPAAPVVQTKQAELQTWKIYTVDGERFAVSLPTVPAMTTENTFNVITQLPYGLTERAVEAAKKLKFCPAVKDGKYVSVSMQLEYHFNLY